MAWIISDNELSSAFYEGFASEPFVKKYIEDVQNLVLTVDKLWTQFRGFVKKAQNKVEEGWKFFKQWLEDDPVAATAGAGAVLLSAGVVLVVGGKAIATLAASKSATAAAGATTSKGLISTLIGWAKVAAKTALVSVTLGALIRFAVRGVQYLWNFNWNVTDTQLVQQQQQLVNQLWGQAGTALGTTLGTLLCGTAPSALLASGKIVKLNPMALAKIKEINEFDPLSGNYGELYEEMMSSIRALVDATKRVVVESTFIEQYKNVRKWIKNGSKFLQLKKTFPWLGNLIEKWGEEGSQSWSFASATEEWLETIKDTNLKSLATNLIESFMEACSESLMVISYAV